MKNVDEDEADGRSECRQEVTEKERKKEQMIDRCFFVSVCIQIALNNR